MQVFRNRITITLLIVATLALSLMAMAGSAAAQGDGGGYGSNWTGCHQPPRLIGVSAGRVTAFPFLSNRVRATPGYSGQIIGRIPPGGVFHNNIGIGSPVCVDGIFWYYVTYQNVTGWTAEGNGANQYWIEPYPVAPAPIPPPAQCTLTPRLQHGGWGQITPGLPNVLRTAPGTTASGANSQVIGRIPAYGVFSVHSNPVCGPDGRYWYFVHYNGQHGWTAEGEGNTYWAWPLH